MKEQTLNGREKVLRKYYIELGWAEEDIKREMIHRINEIEAVEKFLFKE